jgi:hypothetical protein
MRWLSAPFLLWLGACHLADTADPRCEAKTHLQSGQCVADPPDGPRVSIASCVVTPTSITVGVNAEFLFENGDDVERTVTGDDGKVWATMKARQPSAILGITKRGTWRYHVSDCTGGGTVIVQ